MGILTRIVDGLQNVITGLGTRADARSARAYCPIRLGGEQIEAAYDASPTLRKAINIPATDRVRAWRDWQADKSQIEALEAEEKRHQLIAKVKQAEILRGLGGGALILVTPGDPALQMSAQLGKSTLAAVNVVSRWHLQGRDWINDLASPEYGNPTYWTMSEQRGGQVRIHPSRVVCFRGEPLPSIYSASDDDRFWGRGRVPTLLEPAQNLDEALASFAAMIKDAVNVDIGVPKLLDLVSQPDGEQALLKRLSVMMQGSSIINARLYDSGDGDGKGGEKIDRHQMTWAGIPEVIRVYAEAFSMASDIPVTRFWGVSPRGLNATGDHDETNWNKMVETGQELEVRPCLEQIDAALIPSALGSRPKEIWWKFAPLDVPTEKEEADTFSVVMGAVEKVQNTGAIPERAFAEGLQNLISERGWMPGLDQALEKVPESERYGLDPEPGDDDPSALQAEEGGDQRIGGSGPDTGAPAQRGANDAWFVDATPRPLYVRRDVVNVDEIVAWARKQRLPGLQPDLHVTIAYSRQPLDWMKIEGEWNQDDKGQITIKPGGVRIVEPLGDRSAVLLFTSSELSWRHQSIIRAGASHDYDDYQPHISLTGEEVDLTGVEPYRGRIVLGPEIFSEISSG